LAGRATRLVWQLHQLERRLALRPEPAPPEEGERTSFARLLTFTDLVFAVTMCVLVLGLLRDVAAVYTDSAGRGHVLMSLNTAALPSQAADVVVRSGGQDVSALHVSELYGERLEVLSRRETLSPAGNFNLAQMMPSLIKYVLAFSFLALFWAIHRRMFQWIQRASPLLVGANLVFLLGIAVNPFTTFFWSWSGLDDQDLFTWFLSDRQGTVVYALSLAAAASALLLTWLAALLQKRNLQRGYEAVRWYFAFRQMVLVGALLVVCRLSARDALLGNVALVAVLLGSVLLAGWVRHLADWLALFWSWLSIRLLLAINPRAARYRHF
jgi:uncharacterized membrane protein